MPVMEISFNYYKLFSILYLFDKKFNFTVANFFLYLEIYIQN